MEKQKFTATFGGSCYIKGYGRKLYKHGFALNDIAQNGNIVLKKASVSKTKAFDVIDVVASVGKTISFDAILNGDTVQYISNIEVV